MRLRQSLHYNGYNGTVLISNKKLLRLEIVCIVPEQNNSIVRMGKISRDSLNGRLTRYTFATDAKLV